jgi:hypothetical protein
MVDSDEWKAVLRPAIKLGVSVVILLLLRALLGVLPGSGREIPGVGIELGVFVVLGLTLVIAAVLVYYSFALASAIENSSFGTAENRTTGGRIVQLFLLLTALLVLHGGLQPLLAAVALAGTLQFAFDAAFLLAGLGILLAMSYLAIKNVDLLVDALVDAAESGVPGGNAGSSSGGGPSGQSRSPTCPSCGATVDARDAYCEHCGTKLP